VRVLPRQAHDDGFDDAVAALAERRGTWAGDDTAVIALITSLIDQAERWLSGDRGQHGFSTVSGSLLKPG
jgi:hypothetical protein